MAEKIELRIEGKDLASKELKKVDASLGKTQKNVKKTATTFGKLKKSIAGFGPAAKVAFAGVAAGMVAATKATLDFADATAKMADKIGISTASLQELTFAASQSGISQTSLESSMQRFTKRIGEAAAGTGAAKKMYEQMGIAITDSAGEMRGADAILNDVANSIAAMGSQAEKNAALAALFGREGTNLAIMFKDGAAGVDLYREKANDLGLILSDTLLNGAQGANDAMDQLGRSLKATFMAALLELAPTIQIFSEALLKVLQTTGPLLPIITALGVALAAFGAVWILIIQPLTTVVGLLGDAGLVGNLIKLSTTLGPLTALIAAFYVGWKIGKLININTLLDLMSASLEWVKATLWAVGVAAAGVWLSIAAGVRSAAESIKGAFTAVFDFIAAKIEAMKAKVKSLIAAAKSALTGGSSKDEKKATGGRVGLAGGGHLAGFGGGDKIRALLERGEFVIRKEAVRNYGARFFDSLNSMALPQPVGYQTGGAVAAGGGGMNVDMPVNIRASGSDATNMGRMFRNEIIPRLKTALRNNTGSLKTSFQRTMK